jgi:hypothetical protein
VPESRFQIKRSTTDAYSSNVVFGELAYTSNGDILYIGDESNTAIAIAGKRTPGTLTGNQAIVVDSNSEINQLKTTDITIKGNIKDTFDAPLNRKLDVLWKKLGFNVVSTDTIENKLASQETISTNLIIAPSEIWSQAATIPSSKPASNTLIVNVYDSIECIEDTTSQSLRTWKTNIINWIPPRFGLTYRVAVYVDTAGSLNPTSNGTLLLESGSGLEDQWYFDYQSGVLHFVGENIPTAVDATKSIFITGAKYTGQTGLSGSDLSNANLINVTISSLTTPLAVKDGGTGVSSFVANSVIAASNTAAMTFKTGSNGQVMIVSDNDVVFGDLDGGSY